MFPSSSFLVALGHRTPPRQAAAARSLKAESSSCQCGRNFTRTAVIRRRSPGVLCNGCMCTRGGALQHSSNQTNLLFCISCEPWSQRAIMSPRQVAQLSPSSFVASVSECYHARKDTEFTLFDELLVILPHLSTSRCIPAVAVESPALLTNGSKALVSQA